MTTTTPREQTVTDVVHARNNVMRRQQLDAELRVEDQSWTDYRANLTGAAYAACELARPRVKVPAPEEALAAVLAKYADLIAAEDARHAAAVAWISRRRDAIPDGGEAA